MIRGKGTKGIKTKTRAGGLNFAVLADRAYMENLAAYCLFTEDFPRTPSKALLGAWAVSSLRTAIEIGVERGATLASTLKIVQVEFERAEALGARRPLEVVKEKKSLQ